MGAIPSNYLVPIMVPISNDNMISSDNLLIGSSLKYLQDVNVPTNSLLVENSVGIRMPANDMYSLTVNGNINIVAGDILIDGIPLNIGGSNSASAVTGNSDGFINILNFGKFFEQEIESYRIQPTGFYNKLQADEKFTTKDDSLLNMSNALVDYVSWNDFNDEMIWHRSSNIEYDYNLINTNNASVVINADAPIMNVSASGIIPAFYVANKGNVKGILYDDNIAAYSDSRLKKNLEKIDNALEKVNALNGYYYNKVDDSSEERRHVGLIAQEVERILPEVVSEFNGLKSISYPNIIALLIEAIKEITNKINNT
eukprot:764955-Hanusia_phi.AAC.2